MVDIFDKFTQVVWTRKFDTNKVWTKENAKWEPLNVSLARAGVNSNMSVPSTSGHKKYPGVKSFMSKDKIQWYYCRKEIPVCCYLIIDRPKTLIG